jgi:tripartite-type tricarboxylate transporter receptor subunit TctC
MNLRSLPSKLVAAAVMAMATHAASAGSYPDRPIHVVIPYPPGGGTDIAFRIIAAKAGELLNETIIVDNRPGASSMIGTGGVSRAASDGYTLLASDSAFVINPGLLKDKLPYDTVKEFKGVTMMATSPALLVVNPNLPVKTLAELIALAKSEPGKLNFSSGGVGSAPYLAAELFKLAAGIDLTHIPYKGTAPALSAVLSDEVDMGFVGISSAAPYIASGQLRAIAVTGRSASRVSPTFRPSRTTIWTWTVIRTGESTRPPAFPIQLSTNSIAPSRSRFMILTTRRSLPSWDSHQSQTCRKRPMRNGMRWFSNGLM